MSEKLRNRKRRKKLRKKWAAIAAERELATIRLGLITSRDYGGLAISSYGKDKDGRIIDGLDGMYHSAATPREKGHKWN